MEMCVNNQVGDLTNKLRSNTTLKRYLKIFLGVGCLGLLLVGGLIIWAGMATVQHVADLSTDPKVQEQVQKLKTDIPNMPALVKVGCWEKVQSLMNVQVWLETPAAENIQGLKEACLEEKPAN
jgi:hypothetical protein